MSERVMTNHGVVRFIVLALLVAPRIAHGQPRQSGSSCEGPTNVVKVFVLDDPETQGRAMLLVRNDSKQALRVLTVGNGSKPELRVAPFVIPSQIEGPNGWKGSYTFHDESMFMHWTWTTESLDRSVGPGDVIGGFTVTLPAFPKNAEATRYPDGTPVRPIDIAELPFQVYFSTGNCVWGRIHRLVAR